MTPDSPLPADRHILRNNDGISAGVVLGCWDCSEAIIVMLVVAHSAATIHLHTSTSTYSSYQPPLLHHPIHPLDRCRARQESVRNEPLLYSGTHHSLLASIPSPFVAIDKRPNAHLALYPLLSIHIAPYDPTPNLGARHRPTRQRRVDKAYYRCGFARPIPLFRQPTLP